LFAGSHGLWIPEDLLYPNKLLSNEDQMQPTHQEYMNLAQMMCRKLQLLQKMFGSVYETFHHLYYQTLTQLLRVLRSHNSIDPETVQLMTPVKIKRYKYHLRFSWQ
jgi:hypothetical protein